MWTVSDNGPVAKLCSQFLRRPMGCRPYLQPNELASRDPARSLLYLALPQTVLLWNGQEIQICLGAGTDLSIANAEVPGLRG
jgi:hypothetical protein